MVANGGEVLPLKFKSFVFAEVWMAVHSDRQLQFWIILIVNQQTSNHAVHD